MPDELVTIAIAGHQSGTRLDQHRRQQLLLARPVEGGIAGRQRLVGHLPLADHFGAEAFKLVQGDARRELLAAQAGVAGGQPGRSLCPAAPLAEP